MAALRDEGITVGKPVASGYKSVNIEVAQAAYYSTHVLILHWYPHRRPSTK